MARRKIRIFCSPTIVVCTVLAMIALCGLYIFTIVVTDGKIFTPDSIPQALLWTFGSWGMSILLIITGARRVYSIITIDETGVSRSFLGVFCKLHISWDEMAEATYMSHLIPFLFFSKTKKLSTMSYNEAIAVKDAIQITLSKRRYAVIAQYLKQPIVNLPAKEETYYSGKKNIENNSD
ncbi:MAG: hypothetical protein K2M47_07850 [Clostridiales bacterium]|nr:hypothetical protein [Clostridiales bacterium]